MLKKVLGMTLVILSLSVSTFAAIPHDQMHIGRLKPGMTMQQVAEIYGMPQKVISPSKAAGGMYNIAGGMIAGWINDKGVFAQYDIRNDIAGSERITASGGIHIGMTPTDVINCLGKPDKAKSINNIIFYDYNSLEQGIAGNGYPDVLLLRFDHGRLSIISINRY